MKKISTWLRQGHGRALLWALCVSLLMAVTFAGIIFAIVDDVTSSPEGKKFLEECPTLTFKDGIMQNDIIWARRVPIPDLNLPLVIDSSKDHATLPLDPGIYMTRSGITIYNGKEGQQFNWTDLNPNLTKIVIADEINKIAKQSAIAVGVFIMIVYWIGFLLTTLITIFLSWLAKIPTPHCRAWRAAFIAYTVTGLVLLISTAILAVMSSALLLFLYPWITLSALIATVILYTLQGKEE